MPPIIQGNDRYYDELEKEMRTTGLPMYEAELRMLYRVIRKLRLDTRMNHNDILEHLRDVWGMSRKGYYTRLKRIREKYPCP